MQILKDDNKWSTHLKASFEAFKEEIVRQIQHFHDFDEIHLKSEHWRSTSHLSRHYIVAIHLLCFDVICSQRRSRLQAEKKCNIYFHEKLSSSSDENYIRDVSKHNRDDFERWTTSVLDAKSNKCDFVRRYASNYHQFDILVHQDSKNSIQSTIIDESKSTLKIFLRTIFFYTKTRNHYSTIFQRNFNNLELKIFFFVSFWKCLSQIIIVASAKKTMTNHNIIKTRDSSLFIYTNESEIDDKINVSTMTFFISLVSQVFIMTNWKLIYLDFLTKFTVYFEKSINLNLIVTIMKIHSKSTIMNIFTNNQAIIRILKSSKQQFD